MKRSLLLLFFLALGTFSALRAQIGVGEWRVHMAYHDATDCVVLGDRVWVLSDGSLYYYNSTDGDVCTVDKATLLSDSQVQFIRKCDEQNLLLVVYANANIDLIDVNGNLVNLPDFHDNSNYDPTVNDVTVCGSSAYLATRFGIVVVNLKKREFTATYSLNSNILSAACDGNHIVALTDGGMKCGDVNDNLLDPAAWKQLTTATGYQRVVCVQQQFVLFNPAGVYIYKVATDSTTPLLYANISYLSTDGTFLVVGNALEAHAWTQSLTDKPLRLITLNRFPSFSSAFIHGNALWAACGARGLCGFYISSGDLVQTLSSVVPESPLRNYCDYLSFTPDGQRLLVAGGCLNYFGTVFYPATLSYFEDETWTAFDESSFPTYLTNCTSLVQDPVDASHHYASCFGQGILEFRDGQFVSQLDCNNSILQTAVPGNASFTRISRLQYDRQGNLWITNAHATSPLVVMTPDGELHALHYDEIDSYPTITDILFDSNGLIWVVSMRADPGILCIDPKGTLLDTRDDEVRFISEHFVDQDGTSTTLDYIYDICETRDGSIWLLTNQGPFLITVPTDFFSPRFTFTKIKVPRNDGTNYADYLLDAVYTQCMAVDAAGRKWIGTQSSGLYLISEDSYHTIHHFTVDNSPLLSNNINDLAIDGATGEVFIATDRGLVSFCSDATDGAESFERDAVHAFPNPVSPDYDGIVTVNGLMDASQVTILSSNGHVVAAGTSLGGTFTWNVRDASGRRVPTGIYHVLAASSDGRQGIVTRILVVN